jgi:hypothetical protein
MAENKDIVERAIVTIKARSLGVIELQSVAEFTVNLRDPKAAVKTMTRKRRVLGYTRGIPEHSASMTVALFATDEEVNWAALQESGEYFTLIYQENNGNRYACIDCLIGDVSKPYRESGETRATIDIVMCDHKAEQ